MIHLSFHHWRDYCRLIRLEKPIGTTLLLWPCLWSLWLAQMKAPLLKNLIIFTVGTFIMRCAGCIVNDYADRKFDRYVQRTRSRPLATNSISAREAMELLVIFLAIALILVLFTNMMTIKLAFVGAVLAMVYPFMKRMTHWPQAFLGLAYSYPVLMVWTAETSKIMAPAWWLYLGTFFWIIAYDTYYAMVDREDDIKIGVKSTAILFGKYDKAIIFLLNWLTIICFIRAGMLLHLKGYYYLGLIVAMGLFIYQQWLTRHRTREACFCAFLNNNWAGAVIFLGILASLTP